MPTRIYGAGMAGLLTAAMLRRLRPSVHEAQAELPDNHGALLRFRTDAVQRETSQPFRKVRVLKAVKSGGRLRPISTIRDANLYALKVTGDMIARSVLDLSPCDRYIAPDDFITGMARDAIIRVNSPLTLEVLRDLKGQSEINAISTIPMPALMKLVGWEPPAFSWRPIWSVTVSFSRPKIDLYQTIYYPEPGVPWYRASITGNHIIIEYTSEPPEFESIAEIFDDFGIPGSETILYHASKPKRQEYGKLLPLPESVRQEFILAMTDEYNLYSVGRFATWRQILLDDVVSDVRRVETWITQRNSYQRRLDRV